MRRFGALWLLWAACAEETPEAWVEGQAPPVNPNLAVGRTYVLDHATLDYTTPQGWGSFVQVLLGALTDSERALSVLGTRRGQVMIRLGDVMGGPGQRTQDMCALTQDVVLDDLGSLWAGRPGSPLPGRVEDADMAYHRVELVGRLAQGGDVIDRIRFNALVDPAGLQTYLPGQTCQMLILTGAPCAPCPNGTLECVEVETRDGVATVDPSLPRLQQVTVASRAALGCP